ncbi:MAG TPA: FecR family protein [Polyangiaceae bacterium]|nr:FecR family protein [Polyangiaceae bacterium]
MIPLNDPEILLRELADERVPPELAESAQARRERVVEALGRSIRQVPLQRERRTRRFRFLAFAAALCTMGLVGGFALRTVEPPPARPDGIASVQAVEGTLVLAREGTARVVVKGERPELLPGDEMSTSGDGRAEFRTERSVVRVAPATRVRVVSASPKEERLRLAVGQVGLEVEHQEHGSRVVVETADAEIVVHGTAFTVDFGSEEGTRVRVREGVVAVWHGGTRAFVRAGGEWSSNVKPVRAEPAEPRTEVAPSVREPSRAAPNRRTRTPARRAVAQNATPADSSGSLAEENKMFLAAVEARNRGQDRAAAELFGALLGKFPTSKLAEEARVERMRAFTRLGDDARAAAEARRYLARHSNGFAREEARMTALGRATRAEAAPSK